MDILQHILFLNNDQYFKKPVVVELKTKDTTQEIEVHFKLDEKIKEKIIKEAKNTTQLKRAIFKNKKAKIKTSWRCLYYNRGMLKHGIVGVLYDPSSNSINKTKIVIINSSSNTINKEVVVHCYYQLKEIVQ